MKTDASSRSSRHALREATAISHERLDELFGTFDLSQRADYVRFLRAHARAGLGAEAALDARDFAIQLPDWPLRRRGAAVLADLRALGSAPVNALPFSIEADPAAAWGAAYVLEGSRLGGAVLARRVGAGLPRAYLGAPRTDWPAFLAQMEAALPTPAATRSAITAALATFDLFERAGRDERERQAA